MTSFAFATSFLSATVLLLARSVDASSTSTEYKCSGGEFCQLSSHLHTGWTGPSQRSMCTPIGQGLPSGNVFMPTLMGSGTSSPMPYDCIGILSNDLAESGGMGSCVVTCPGSCTVTPNVASPCTGSTPPDENNDMDMDSTSGAKGTNPIALASVMIGAVAANTLL